MKLCISMRISLRLTQRFSGPLLKRMQKVERKRISRLWSDRAGKAVGKRSWGGEREKEQEGLAPSLGLGEGLPVMGMGFGQNKGPSWIGRPFGNKVLALFYFPT